jgi:hypothetical protein
MRDNGLRAASYVAIADLTPRVAEAMLDILRDAHVAAYLEPCQPAAPSLEIRIRPLPCDRLFVDEAEQERARRLVDEHAARLRDEAEGAGLAAVGGDGRMEDADAAGSALGSDDPVGGTRMATFDEDRAFAEIVAGYDRPVDDVVPRWPVEEDVDDDDSEPSEPTIRLVPDASDPGEEDTDELTGLGDEAPSEDRYVPPPPPPLPKIETATKLAWLAMMVGPVLLVLSAAANIYVPTWLGTVAVLAFVGGFVALVVRMKGGPPDNEDGAIV